MKHLLFGWIMGLATGLVLKYGFGIPGDLSAAFAIVTSVAFAASSYDEK